MVDDEHGSTNVGQVFRTVSPKFSEAVLVYFSRESGPPLLSINLGYLSEVAVHNLMSKMV